jgi:hypothetical protein
MNSNKKSIVNLETEAIPQHRAKFNATEESLSIQKKFEELQDDGYKLYEMSLTYSPFSNNRSHTPDGINKIFKQFYLNNFLRDYIFKSRYWTKKFHDIQPITYCFMEEHEIPQKAWNKVIGIYQCSDRLHHHAVMAAHPKTIHLIDTLLGEKTLLDFHSSIMTSSLQEADSNWVLYATKNYKKHEENWMLFGPKAK